MHERDARTSKKHLVPEEQEHSFYAAKDMYADALQLAPKIAGAEGADLYKFQ